jgi:hypothetical protein
MTCPMYKTVRIKYINQKYLEPVSYENFILLISTQDIDELRNLAIYVYKAERMRF